MNTLQIFLKEKKEELKRGGMMFLEYLLMLIIGIFILTAVLIVIVGLGYIKYLIFGLHMYEMAGGDDISNYILHFMSIIVTLICATLFIALIIWLIRGWKKAKEEANKVPKNTPEGWTGYFKKLEKK